MTKKRNWLEIAVEIIGIVSAGATIYKLATERNKENDQEDETEESTEAEEEK